VGNPTFWSVLLWIGAGLFALLAVVAISPMGRTLPQRGQGFVMFTLIGLVLTGLGFLTSAPREVTPEEAASAERMVAADHRKDLITRLAGFPFEAEQTTSHLASMNASTVADMEGAVDAVRFLQQAGHSIMIVENAATSGEVPVSAEVLAAKDRLKVALVRKQRALFPEIRRTYAAYLSDAVSGTAANFRAVGSGAKTLRGASPSFMSRDVVSDAHHALMVQATQFRFAKAEYVYSGTGASYAMTVNGDADGDIG
jgi:signal transduction histidine kinase